MSMLRGVDQAAFRRAFGLSRPIRRDVSLDHVVARVVPSPNALAVVDNNSCYCGSVNRALIVSVAARPS